MTNIAIRSFTGGELSPSLYARVDLAKYQQGARKIKNFFVQKHGGVANRSGGEFICEVKDSTKTIRKIPFIFNSDQTYVLEFGNLYLRIIRNGVQQTLAAQNITGITQANPAEVTITAHGYSTGDEVYITGVLGMTEVNNRNFKITSTGANTFTLQKMNGTNLNSTGFTAYSSVGTAAKVYQVTTPYVEADLPRLKFVQSADVITLVHPNYAPRELSRSGHTSWSLSTITFAPTISTPTSVTNSGGAGATFSWVVTAIETDTYQESLQSSATTSSTTPSSGTPVTVSWAAVSGAQEYNVYRYKNGVYGFVGVASSTSFVDDGITPDTASTPPISRNPFNSTGDYPSCVTYFQQRLCFGNTDNNPETVYMSKSGSFKNFTISSPLQDDDAVTFALAGRQVNEVEHLIDVGELLSMTTGAEWAIEGGSGGAITPTSINAKQHSYVGSSYLAPIIISGNALFVQARGNLIRDLGFDYTSEGYRGNDLTIFSTHLFEGKTIVDWAYQQIPNSVIWCVRSDGILLGLTYVREHQVWAWHQHEFENGLVENVVVVPEGDEDYLYLTIKRTINSVTVRYIERMNSRYVSASTINDATFLDSYLSYDGRNTTATTMTLSGGTDWVYTETLTLTASASFFVSTDIGNQIFLYDGDDVIRFTIDAYSSGTVVTGRPNRTVPVSLRSVAITDWSKAVDQVSGLWHLEGEQVSVFGDGQVVASKHNDAYTAITISNGTITLDKPYSVIHVGIPITADIETLDIDTVEGESLADKKKLVSKVTLFVESSRGIFIGSSEPTGSDYVEHLEELKIRDDESYDEPVTLTTGVVDVNIRSEWNSNGRVFIRQIDPLPLSVLAVVPSGLFPFRN